ncbi:periplasmic chaperone for outer membrane proteins SurA [Breoghania corrubedonensis]|uniref:Periplasmic chaperone for outer membrane proteins SurA n=1 Tax=Breoghania corrubedonensis TaxID=665038 RepID=A0A2T5V9K4_9HYPH|nr:SurA N-terminal domain-containing protein [Breoghania corrubedonensis]PTW60437.1 periplasmic chaperone for outer membrane proteins SurA [Breoghania corrubedonensis]
MMPTTADLAGRKRARSAVSHWLAALFAVALAGGILGGIPLVANAATSIKVIVNDQPITNYDISQRARLIQLTARKSAGVSQRMAQDELIEERLKMQEAKRRGVSVSDAEVEQAFARIASRTKMSPKQLGAALSRSGVNPSTLKDRIRTEIMWHNVVLRRFRAQVNVSEQDVVAAMLKQDKDKVDVSKTTEYTLSQVIFVIPKNASASLKAQRKKEANSLRHRFTDCDSGLKFAESLKEVVVKPVGVRLAPELPDEVIQLLKDVPSGHLSTPVETGSGISAYAVCKKREIDSDAGLRTQIKDELRNKEGQMMARRYLRDLRRDAVIEYR